MARYYNVVTLQNMVKLSECFANSDEFDAFMSAVDELSDEIRFNLLLMRRLDHDESVKVAMKQVLAIALFFREHVELVNQLVRVVDCKKMTKKELEEFEKRGNDVV